MQTGAAYIRVSTIDQTELSPDAQKRLILEYAKRNDILIPKQNIFIDEGISGRKAEKRPAFMQMIATAKIKPRLFDVILVHKFDRFSRSREDSIVYKSLLRKECGIQVISITEQIEDDKFAVILEAMLEAMAEYYSLNLAEEVTKGMTEKALRGGYQARPPLGYKIEHKGALPTIVPEEAKIIKKIYSLYVNENKTIYEICKYLNSFNLKTSNNKSFEKRSIQYILQNPTYIGMVRWNRTHNATNTVKDNSEWIIEKGQYESIIDESTFRAANERLEQEMTFKGARPIESQKHWLSGILKCSNCGRTLVVSNRYDKRYHKLYKNFQCYGYSKGKCLVSHQISESKVVTALLRELEDFLQKEDDEFVCTPSRTTLDEIANLEMQLHKTIQKEDRIREAYINGIDTIEEYLVNKTFLANQKDTIESHLMQIQSQNTTANNNESLNQKVKNVYDILTSDTVSMTQKNLAIKSIFDKIVYDKENDNLSYYYFYS
ncbi:recombinase family protein [Anaeromicropila herbilytica]|uniref:Serine recombinase n=1 Tax=Anaeromicropila herbilytica TaxID=2785025 RepID=A0A7R7EK28_9FIRM|nr:recombinase family protein [Anaeromicropila herbilytica]BCN30140.1 serine recombinase [Anaeromicropila herbilytica]